MANFLDTIFNIALAVDGVAQVSRKLVNFVGFDVVSSATQLSLTPRSFASHEAGITASTTQTQGQRPLTARLNQIAVVANANDTVTLPAAVAALEVVVINKGANTLRVYPASGDNLGAGVDTATTQATGVTNRYIAYDSTNWVKL